MNLIPPSAARWALRGLCAAIAATLCACATPSAPTSSAASPDDVVFRFATMGDSRYDPKAPEMTGQDKRWHQSTAVLARVLREVEQFHPQAFMFNGDMVMGYTANPAELDREYAYWRGMMAGLMERGTYVLPVPGNHELQMPTERPGKSPIKLAQPHLEDAWRANTGDLILDSARWQQMTGTQATAWRVDNAPALGSDGITTSQQQLSYSFDVGAVHIAVINTDPVGYDSSAPVHWLAADFAAAKQRGAHNYFVFGHKMAYAYVVNPAQPEKSDAIDARPAVRDAFWDLIETYGATYFCGHQHVFHASQPRQSQGGHAWQVIVGSGGSPFSVKPGQSANPQDRMYAWAEVSVHRDGKTQVQVRGFDEAKGATRTLQSWKMR